MLDKTITVSTKTDIIVFILDILTNKKVRNNVTDPEVLSQRSLVGGFTKTYGGKEDLGTYEERVYHSPKPTHWLSYVIQYCR